MRPMLRAWPLLALAALAAVAGPEGVQADELAFEPPTLEVALDATGPPEIVVQATMGITIDSAQAVTVTDTQWCTDFTSGVSPGDGEPAYAGLVKPDAVPVVNAYRWRPPPDE